MTAKLYLLYTDADILAAVKISDNPEIMCLHELPEEHQAFIGTARLQGCKPVCARWPGGQFSILFCEPGTDMPSVTNILRAYNACLNTCKTFPEGETS